MKLRLLGVGRCADGDREVFWEVNGRAQTQKVPDKSAGITAPEAARPKATADPGSVGSPLAGLVVEYRVEAGRKVNAGDPILVLSAMKMEMIVTSDVDGTVGTIHVPALSDVESGDLLVTILP